jgi:hypothetical protein
MKERFIKRFFVSEVHYGFVDIEVSEDTSEFEAESRVHEAIDNGNVVWTDSEVTDITEE